MAKKLEGKVAVVTGASKGIGAEIAKHFAAEGASVVVNYASSKSGADAVVNDIAKKGGKAIAVQGDVAKQADVEKLLAETKKAFGKLDILVNNAGIYEFSPLGEITTEHFRKLYDTNVLGLLSTSREAIKYFTKEGGSIINISSLVSVMGVPTASAYSGTKGAVDSITRVLAKELGPSKIRVNSINPGMVITEGVKTAGFEGTDFQKDIESRTPLGRIGQPEDIAPAAVFFASQDSAWITGETLVIAGGLR
jgi:3-oxoacyl-[acyl-carrier protein] reductase